MAAENRSSRYRQLISAMVRTGVLGYGGGPSTIPLFRYEAVTRFGWMKDEEFGEVLAIANALPGPIATKIAAYIGYRQQGWAGAAVAMLAHILPSCAAMLALMSIVGLLSSSPIVAGMIAAVMPVVAVMIGMMAYEFAQRTLKGLGKTIGFAMFAVSFLLLEAIPVHPAIVIAVFLGYGAFHFKAAERLRSRFGKSSLNKRKRKEDT